MAVARWFFLIWGVVSFVAVAILGGIAAYWFSPHSSRDDTARINDVRFVLNCCELGDQRIEKVVHSHVSERSFTGDHLDAYAIKVSHVEIAELTAKTDHAEVCWYLGDQLPPVVESAVNFIGNGWLSEVPWFPNEVELRGADMYVYAESIDFNGERPSATNLVFVRPSDRMVFYIGCAM